MAIKVTRPQIDLREEINKALTLSGLKNQSITVNNLTSIGNVAIGTAGATSPLTVSNMKIGYLADNAQSAHDFATVRLNTYAYNGSSVGLSIGGLSPNVQYLQGGYNEGTSAPISLNPYGGNVGIGTDTPEGISGRLTIGKSATSDQNDYGISILTKGTNDAPGTWDHSRGAINIVDTVGQGPAAYSNVGIVLNAGLGRIANGDTNTHLGSLIHISYDSGNSPIYMDARGNTWFGYPRASAVTDSTNTNSVKIDGALYIGNPTSNNGSCVSSKKIVMGEANSNSAIHMRVNGGGGYYSVRDEVNSPNNEFRVGHLNGTNRIEISVNNNNAFANGVQLTAGATSWTTFSDERRKTDLAPIENGLEKVATLRAVTGRYNHDEPGTRRSFLIAQDVEKVLPEAVGELTASMDDPTEYKTLSYTDTIPLLVSALKDAKDRIDTLEAEINKLKGL